MEKQSIFLQLSQLIPIILTFIFLKYTNMSVVVSHTVLGKLFAIALIVFYTRIDAILGLFVCLFVIYYYQTDYVEGMKDGSDESIPQHSMVEKSENPDEEEKEEKEEEDKEDKKKDSGTSTNYQDIAKVILPINTPPDSESFANYETSYQTEPSVFGADVHPCPKKQKFTQEHCEHQTLKYKNQPVRPDITNHIFTEISFNDTPCNICDKGCKYNIIPKLQQEELIRRPTGIFGLLDGNEDITSNITST